MALLKPPFELNRTRGDLKKGLEVDDDIRRIDLLDSNSNRQTWFFGTIEAFGQVSE